VQTSYYIDNTTMLKKIFQKRTNVWPLDAADCGILAAGLTVFVAAALVTITKFSIWFDEAFGAYLIRFDFWHVATYTAADVHPPFYYWLLKIWSMVFGTSEIGLRSMSIFFGAVAIFFGYLLMKRLFGRRAAVFSLLLLAISPMFIRYSQEMRMYTLVTAIVMAATYVLTLATETGKRKLWIAYGVLVALGMWTHYFAALAWLAHWAWRAWVVGKTENRKQFVRKFFSKDWIVAHIVAVGIFLPWVPALVFQTLNVQINGFWIPPVTPATLPNFLTNVLYYQDQDTVNPWLTLLFMVVAAAVIIWAVWLYRQQGEKDRRSFMLVGALAFVPIALLFITSMPPLRSSFVDRYLIPSTLAILLFTGVVLAFATQAKKKWLPVGITIVTVGALIFGIYNVYQLGNYNKTLRTSNNTRQVVEAVTAQAKDGEAIVTDTPWVFYEAVFYTTPSHPVYFLDETTDYKYGSLNMLHENDYGKIKSMDEFAKTHETVWYISRSGSSLVAPPKSTWQQLQQITVNDLVSGQPLYKATEYKLR
jgi:mannosyltransferase